MLPPPNRLPKQEIKEVTARGARVVIDELTLRYKKTNGQPRFVFVVSTKIDKRATKRNRIRRILSESVRSLLPRIVSIDGVFIVRENIAARSQKDAEELLIKILTAANLI
jgi:ribonuclease P protein component